MLIDVEPGTFFDWKLNNKVSQSTVGLGRCKMVSNGFKILLQSKCQCTLTQCAQILACSGSTQCTCVASAPVVETKSENKGIF